ncbi:MAG: hypothetical protein LBV01_03095, partial [Deltaproteobacteria bacterium]|nr:hypothetical protein [Deltaproteobacteria bacterium]
MTTSFQNLRRPVAFCCLLVLCGFAMSGCIFDKTVIQSGPTRPGQTQVPGKPAGTAQPGAGDAENAWNAGQAARAEQIATRLLSQPGLSIGDTARVARVLALSASAGGHPYLAMTALERWLGADRNADASPEWRTVFMAVLGQLPPRDAAARAMGVVENPARPLPLRADAALFLASRQWEREQGGPQALADLRVFYTQVPERADRAQMERSLFARLRDIDGALLANLDVLVTEENRKDYPYALVRLETLRRKALHAATREEAKEGAALLAEGSALADPAILGVWDAPEQPPAAVATPIAGRTLVLALPLSGGLGSIGMKVSQGAEAARKEFADSGYSLGLVTLDTQ